MRMWKAIIKFLHKKLSKGQLKRKLSAYLGWLKYCNSKHLLDKIHKLILIDFSNWRGIKTTFKAIANKNIRLVNIEVRNSFCKLQFVWKNKPYFIISKNFPLCMDLERYKSSSIIF